MALHYYDTSGLAKRYLPERGSGQVLLLSIVEGVGVSELTIAEMASVFARRVREGSLSSEQADSLYRSFVQDWATFRIVPRDLSVLQAAAALMFSAPSTVSLRTLDALHIVSAQQVFAEAQLRRVTTGDFVTADRNLLAAAAWAGFTVLNPEDFP